MKKIGIDARLYSQTGVGTYIRNLIYYLSKNEYKDMLFYIYIFPEDIPKLPHLSNQFVVRPVSYRWHTIAEQWQFLYSLISDKLDLMHFTYFGFPILYNRPFIATVHDVTPLLYRTGKASTRNFLAYIFKWMVFSFVLRTQIWKAQRIIVPSFAVKDSLIRVFGRKYEKKIKVVYEGVSYEFFDKKSPLRNLKKVLPEKYYLYVGNFYPHKNVKRLVEAYARVKTQSHLVLMGPKDFFSSQIASLVQRLNLKGKVLFVHNPTVTDLIYAYKHAQTLVHPSVSEGFGLPIVEAQYFNCPVIASDIPLFHELLSSKSFLFNPYDTEDIARKLDLFQKNKNTAPQVNEGKQTGFSFRKMTVQTLSLYRNITSLQ